MHELKKIYNKKKNIIKQRLKDFDKDWSDEELFYELCFCIMAVQTKGRKSDLVVQELKKKDFYNKKLKLEPILKKHVRFHNTKSKNLEYAKTILNEVLSIRKKEKCLAREGLISLVRGFGYKEASHFLRNTGTNGLAILDRHILKNLKRYNVINELPKSLTKKQYLFIEEKFKDFSNEINIPFDHLDLLFWSMETGEVFK